MSAYVVGKLSWSLDQDDERIRTYTTEAQVLTSSPLDGPAIASNAVGLPTIGAVWYVDNDYDPWCWCRPRASVRPLNNLSEPDCNWVVTNYWSNAPLPQCSTNSYSDPILEPPKMSGSYIKWMEEALIDRQGDLLLMSSQERMKGPVVEVEKGRPTVNVSMNLSSLPLSNISSQRGTVNSNVLWGLGPRTILLADVTWERNAFGTCGFYYTVNYTFEIKHETYDRYVIDEGTRVLWKDGEDPTNLNNYVPYRDPLFDQPSSCLLNGYGRPATSYSNVWVHRKELEDESNFLDLGIPTSI